MYRFVLLTLFLPFLPFSSFCDKIEKKGTLLNSSCKPIGTRCKTQQIELTYTFICNEPRPGNFSLKIAASEVQRDAALLQFLHNKSLVHIDEAIAIPDDVARVLRQPIPYTVPKGTYTVIYQMNYFTIIFKE